MGFLKDLLTAVEAQGLQGVSFVRASAAGSGAAATSTTPNGSLSNAGACMGDGSAGAGHVDEEPGCEDDEAEPAYLDDEEDDELLTSYEASSPTGGMSNGFRGPLGA